MGIGRLHRTTVKRVAFTAAGVLIGVAGVTTGTMRDDGGLQSAEESVAPAAHTAEPVGDFAYQRLTNPGRTVVTDGTRRVVATMTDGSRTVNVLGPTRTFSEPPNPAQTAQPSVTSQTWVRLLPHPWAPGTEAAPWFRGWLDGALNDRTPDILDISMQYLTGSTESFDAQGNRYRGNARFGLYDTDANGRLNRSDFFDYLGRPWTFPDGRVEAPDPAFDGAVDDSGFIRLVFGYRSGLPLLRTSDDDDAPPGAIPRGTQAIASKGPGTTVVADQQLPVSNFGPLQPGDLVFFDTDPDRKVDTAGIYVGVDDGGHHRFIASRAAADGPTMGDAGGAAILDGNGDYAEAFRSAKRL